MNQIIQYRNKKIRHNPNQLISLTDLWDAAGRPQGKHDPRRWKTFAGQQFIDSVAKKLNVFSEDIYKSTRGKGGGSWAHWQIALAYAKYLSDDLHMHVNEVYMRYRSGDVTLADEIADKASPKDQEWLAKRVAGKVKRRGFTDVLQEHGVDGKGYGTCTNAIYVPLLGGTARDVKTRRNLPQKASLRDAMDVDELVAVAFAEMASTKRIKKVHAHGTEPCARLCSDTAKKVAEML